MICNVIAQSLTRSFWFTVILVLKSWFSSHQKEKILNLPWNINLSVYTALLLCINEQLTRRWIKACTLSLASASTSLFFWRNCTNKSQGICFAWSMTSASPKQPRSPCVKHQEHACQGEQGNWLRKRSAKWPSITMTMAPTERLSSRSPFTETPK